MLTPLRPAQRPASPLQANTVSRLVLRRPLPIPDDAARRQWQLACAARLAELRPGSPQRLLMSLAADMWPDVGSFDPVIAAEMEHESWDEPAGDED